MINKILQTKFNGGPKQLVKTYGPETFSNKEQSVWKQSDFTFIWDKKKSLYYMVPKSLIVHQLPFSSYEFQRRSNRDQNLGGVLSVPKMGIYMMADPDGKISRVYWKGPWDSQRKSFSTAQIGKLLKAPRAGKK